MDEPSPDSPYDAVDTYTPDRRPRAPSRSAPALEPLPPPRLPVEFLRLFGDGVARLWRAFRVPIAPT